MRHESCESRQHETWTIGGAGTGEGAFFWLHGRNGRNGRVSSLFMSPLLEGYVMDNGLTTRDGYVYCNPDDPVTLSYIRAVL